MAPLKILEFPDPRLRKVAKHIQTVDSKIVELADQMLSTMYEAPGIGLAASQVNIHKRLIVIDTSESRDQPLVLINPEIKDFNGSTEIPEGCLSIPGFYEPVNRFQSIEIHAVGRNGEPYTLEASDLLAVCIQHEMDHLEGKLFVDYLSNAKRSLIRRKLRKLQKQRA